MSTISRPSILLNSNSGDETNHTTYPTTGNEVTHPIDRMLAETKNFLKMGLYRKTYKYIEEHRPGLGPVPISLNIKLHRRMVICMTRICERYLVKGEIQRVDNFKKLMNKTFEYLESWHNLICTHISKTNPKYANMHKLLDEVSELYEDTYEATPHVRNKGRNHTTMNNSSFMSTNESTKPSTFMNKLRNNTVIGKVKFVEDYNATDAPRLVTEVQIPEVNSTFHLDEFIKYLIGFILNWVTFYRRTAKKHDVAFRFLQTGYKLSKIIDSCLDADTLQVVVKARIALGLFFLEFGRHEEALLVFESAMVVIQVEVSLRIQKARESVNSLPATFKFKNTARFMIITFINMSICYEQMDNYHKVLEALRLGIWFAGRFMAHDDEAYIMISHHYNHAFLKYDHYLKELGEIQRVIEEQNVVVDTEEAQKAETSEHFGKMNSYLYDRFDYDKLNVSQAIVFPTPIINHNRRESTTMRGTEFLSGERDRLDSTDVKYNWNKTGDTTMARTQLYTSDGFDSYHTNWKHNNTTGALGKSGNRERKKRRARIVAADEENRRPLTSEKYRSKATLEKEAMTLVLDDYEEQEYIEKLNRNIKDGKKSAKKKQKEANFLDLDKYFEKEIEEKIQKKEEDMHIKPISFKQVIKNYAHFDKSELYDKVEFSFASRTLTSKARENLADYTISAKYKPPLSKIAQVNEVKIEAQLHEAKNQAMTKVLERKSPTNNMFNAMAQTAKASFGRSVKFASQLEIESKPSITEPNTTKHHTGMANFSSIMVKHQNALQLNQVANTINEFDKLQSKSAKKDDKKDRMKIYRPGKGRTLKENTLPTLNDSKEEFRQASNRDLEPEDRKKNVEHANNMIQLLMEGLEKTIESDMDIRRRIEESKPLVEAKKVTARFLKVPDSLAESTKEFRVKQEGKKAKSIFGAVKGLQMHMQKKKVLISAGGEGEL